MGLDNRPVDPFDNGENRVFLNPPFGAKFINRAVKLGAPLEREFPCVAWAEIQSERVDAQMRPASGMTGDDDRPAGDLLKPFDQGFLSC
jgi:hypothetical protein